MVAAFDRKVESVEKKLMREKRELKEDQAEHSARKQEELGTHLETILGIFGGRRRSVSTSLRKRRLTQSAKMDIEESIETIKEFEKQLEALADEEAQTVDDIEAKWAEIAADVTEIRVSPFKKDTAVTLFGVAWVPYHVVDSAGRILELPGFSAE